MKRYRAFAGAAALAPGDLVVLSPEESHHLCVVRRVRPGQELEVFDQQGEVFLARLESVERKSAAVKIIAPLIAPPELPYRVHLFAALCKEGAWRLILEKSVELGVFDITPVWTRFSVPSWPRERDAERRLIRWQQIILNAVKQSRRIGIPQCRPLVPFTGAVEQGGRSSSPHLLLWEQARDTRLSEVLNACRREVERSGGLSVMVGPEGGFHPDEVEEARHAGWTVCGLGPHILRAETAVMSALSVVHTVMGTF
ncbi:MAG: 16S rRNA (uracil(1498)-N(3))-methyltransferase [Candidatus Sumerlaeia bacterium]